MTKAFYIATSEYVKEMDTLPVKRRVSVSGILKKLGVSRSGYSSWKRHTPSNAEIHRNQVKEKIMEIYDTSHQNYGAPKITIELQKAGESILEKDSGKLYASNGNQGTMDQTVYPNNH
ncbi:MAG: IS3 family transposase [Mediterraneibacter faecis]